jgi:glycosyl hydrolase family 12
MIRRLSRVAFWLLLLVAFLISPGSVAADETSQALWWWKALREPTHTYAYNNLWNTRGARGSQSITVYDEFPDPLTGGPKPLWSTTWDWKRGQGYTVTSYASSVTGWHWGEKFDTTTRLPVPVSQLVSDEPVPITTTMDYLYEENSACSGKRAIICRYDVAYDLWFHNQDPTGTGNSPKFELMVWLSYSRDALFVGYESVIQPLPFISGHYWKVLQTTSTNAVFVIADDADDVNRASLNLEEFIKVATTLNSELSSWLLTSIEFGIEVYQGKGTFTVKDYHLTIGNLAP